MKGEHVPEYVQVVTYQSLPEDQRLLAQDISKFRMSLDTAATIIRMVDDFFSQDARCAACLDPEGEGDYVSAFQCPRCRRMWEIRRNS